MNAGRVNGEAPLGLSASLFVTQRRRVIARHSNNPPVRRNGRTKRSPSAVDDVKIAFTLAKRHSDADASHRALTESIVSLRN
eukprot:410608-Pleurochrysis_carterae.AAC.2